MKKSHGRAGSGQASLFDPDLIFFTFLRKVKKKCQIMIFLHAEKSTFVYKPFSKSIRKILIQFNFDCFNNIQNKISFSKTDKLEKVKKMYGI